MIAQLRVEKRLADHKGYCVDLLSGVHIHLFWFRALALCFSCIDRFLGFE